MDSLAPEPPKISEEPTSMLTFVPKACRVVIISGLIIGSLLTSYGQTASASEARLTMQTGEARGLVSKDAFGKPCLDIEAAARAHISNPNVYDHVISVMNRCVKNIRAKICYLGTERCSDIALGAMKRRDILLGVNPGMKTFKFSYREIP